MSLHEEKVEGFEAVGFQYRGTSPIRNCLPLGSYSRTMTHGGGGGVL